MRFSKEDLDKIKKEKPIYTITTFEKDGSDPSDPYHNLGAQRTPGFYYEYDTAVQALNTNSVDFDEAGLYQFAMIERVYPGMYCEPGKTDRTWFAYDPEKDGYFETEEPEQLKGLAGFGIG